MPRSSELPVNKQFLCKALTRALETASPVILEQHTCHPSQDRLISSPVNIHDLFGFSEPVGPPPPQETEFCVFFQSLVGHFRRINSTSHDTIAITKEKIQKEFFNYPPDQQRLCFGGVQLADHKTLSDYNIQDQSVIHLVHRLPGIGWFGPRGFLSLTYHYLQPSLLDPDYNYDFTNLTDPESKFRRGGLRYQPPCGFMRFGLKVKGKFSDDRWLGENCRRRYSSPGEWPVAYHGTTFNCGEIVSRQGHSKVYTLRRFVAGYGIYTTPSLDYVTDDQRTRTFMIDGRRYKMVLQVRVNPKNMVHAEAKHTGLDADFFISPSAEDVRPYGICIKEVP